MGFCDGVYLKYGGKEINCVDRKEQRTDLASIRLLLLIETIVLILLSVVLNNNILFAFSLSVMSFNMMGYFKNLYQAVGQFEKYSRILNITTFLTFAVNIGLLVLKTDNYSLYLLGYVSVNAFIWFLLEIFTIKNIGYTFRISLVSMNSLIENIKSGILLMVGNLSSLLFTGMDRWFVRYLMTTYDFALYSFAVSLEGFLNVAVTPLTITLYNYFCNHRDIRTTCMMRKIIVIFSSVIITSAFLLQIIIERFLPDYTDSIRVMFILFVAQIFFIPNKAIYVNLYKADGRQNRYFFQLIFVLMIGLAANIMFYFAGHQKEAFAYATLASSFVWLLLSIRDFREYKITFKEILYGFAEVGLFMVSSTMQPWAGLMYYLTGTLALTSLLMRDGTEFLIRYFLYSIKKKNL